jgi:type 2 lantibiotic biosynthesis protein LanM
MLNIVELLTNSRYRQPRWEVLTAAEKKEDHFLVLLAPVMEYVLAQLEQYMINNLTELNALLEQRFLFNTVQRDLSAAFSIMIARACVLQMHTARVSNLLTGATPQQRFQCFIEQLKQPAIAAALLQKYPALITQIDIFITHYLTAKKEFFLRLRNDSAEIFSLFLANNKNYRLIELSAAGDRHRQGRSVAILTFADGETEKKVVYKPRSLAIDVAFQQFIDWFNQLSEIKLFTLRILNKSHYGWCEFISCAPCAAVNGIEDFYRRMGNWLMLVYLLNGSDLHFENIIAHGAHPVIVDYECFFKPFILFKPSADLTLPRRLVTDTLFLPHKIQSSENYSGVDVSALGGAGGEKAPYRALQWKNSGTDAMRLARVTKKMLPSHNIPTLPGQNAIDPLAYQQYFLQGFVAAYHIILQQLPALLSNNSPLNIFKKTEVRILFRNTSDYGKLLLESYHPELLAQPHKRQAHFSWLNNALTDRPAADSIIAAELTDINAGNIPAFFCRSDAKIIFDSADKPVALPVLLSGWQCVQEQIKHSINSDDLQLQKILIANSFEAMALNRKSFPGDFLPPNTTFSLEKYPLEERALLLARKQLDHLLATHIVNRGRIFWPAVNIAAGAVWNPAFTDINLYNGVAGIMLAFAYGGFILNEPRYTALAQMCLSSLRLTLQAHGSKCFTTVGAFDGASGLIYAFGSLYKLWRDDALKIDIEHLCATLPEAIGNDIHLDIISGAAGCLASLLSVREIVNNSMVDPLLHICAHHILEKYPRPEQFPLTGNSQRRRKPLLGFSHGIAGIAWALARYHFLHPATHLKDWVSAALAYERKEFNAEKNNWPDFRRVKDHFVSAWCHGAPGIGLARCDMPNVWRDNFLGDEIAGALQNIRQRGLVRYHGLCHGNLGNLELLLQINLHQPSAENSQASLNYTTALIDAIEQQGARCELPQPHATPGMMTGIAGVAYQLLRIAKPNVVPALLLLK